MVGKDPSHFMNIKNQTPSPLMVDINMVYQVGLEYKQTLTLSCSLAVRIQQRATLSSLQVDKVDTHKASTEATQQRCSIERITPKIEPGQELPCGSSDDQKKAAGKNQTVYISSSADERSPRYKYPHRYTRIFYLFVCEY